MKIRIIYIFFMLLTVSLLAETSDFDSLTTTGIHEIYNIKFDAAHSTFQKLISEYPRRPAGYFFDAMIYWWRIMLDWNNEDLDDVFLDKLDEVIDLCDDILDDNPDDIDALFFKGGSLGFKGRLHAVREDWFAAGLDGKEALPLVYEAYELDPNNNDVQLGFGIYNYYASVIPEQYPFVKPIMVFFPSGDKQKGIQELEQAAYNGKYAKIEARYFLMTLYYKYESDYRNALKFADLLVGEFPDNPTFHRYYGRINVALGDYNSASKIYKNILKKCQLNYFGYNSWTEREAYYYIAMDFKNKNILDSAIVYFNKCSLVSREIDVDEESGYLINSLLYTGMIYEEKSNYEKAAENFEQVLDMREYKSSHDTAQRHLDAIEKIKK